MSARVLIVEDSPTQAAALHAQLEEEGYDVTVTATGEAGLAQMDRSRFDAVISDVVMPGTMNGYDLCRNIKSGPHKETPVVLLTSLTDPLDIILGLECGADNFLIKPYQTDHLLDRLKTLLGTRATRTHSRLRMGVEVVFMGREFTITSEREQILNLLISTFEDAVRQNQELRRREEELETAREELARYAGTLQERLHHVLASTPAVIYSGAVKGETFAPTWISENVVRLTGFTVEEALEPSWWADHLHAEDRNRILAEMPAVLQRTESILEYRFQQKEGAYRWVRDHTRLILGPAGQPSEIVGAWVDITDERQLEEQVRLSQKMEAIGTLAGGVAHDFNNLLAVIRGTVDLALVGLAPDAPVREDLGEIAETVDRATVLTRQLLAFGRRQVLEPRALDLNALVSDTVKMLTRIMGEDIRLAASQTPEALTVHADPGQLDQVLMNLAVNARDAMPLGGEVTIATERVDIGEDFCASHPWARPGNYARVTVSDTGTGMDAATQSRIFEPFFTTKEMGRGTGLGLAVVYGIVKQHGGMIHVYSEPAKGTAFRIYLPIHTAAPEPIALTPSAPARGGTETILLAEDDAALRVTATRLLEQLGYQIIAVPNGHEAVRVLRERGDSIQLAVIDVVMPGMGGHRVFEQVHAEHPGLRFIFTTGYSPGTSHTEPIRTLPAEVLAKPYGLQALGQVVRRALDAGPRLV